MISPSATSPGGASVGRVLEAGRGRGGATRLFRGVWAPGRPWREVAAVADPTPPGQPQPQSGGARSSLDRVLAALARLNLAVRPSPGGQVMAQCPAHDERTPSLHVTWRPGQRGGFTLLHCFGCGAKGQELADALGLSLADLFDEPLPERDRWAYRASRPAERRKGARRRGPLGRLPAVVPVGPAKPGEPEDEPRHEWVEVTRYPYVDCQGTLVQGGHPRGVLLRGGGREAQAVPAGLHQLGRPAGEH